MNPEETTRLYERILRIEASIKELQEYKSNTEFQNHENNKHIKLFNEKVIEIQNALDKIEKDVKEEEIINSPEEEWKSKGYVPQLVKKLSFWDKLWGK